MAIIWGRSSIEYAVFGCILMYNARKTGCFTVNKGCLPYLIKAMAIVG
jgi:hypothetical protein